MAYYTLVTGASAGIGKELARRCADDGRNLVLLARRENELESLADELRSRHGVGVDVLARDLALPGAAEQAVEVLRSRGLDVDTLINNAGFGHLGAFHHADTEKQMAMLRVNVLALTELTRQLLPPMVERESGHILNVASTAAFQPGPFMAVYYATKAYVLSFSEAIAEELRGTGVSVTALCPGPTATEFQERAGMEGSGLLRFGLQDARSVAAVGYHAMVHGKAVAVPGLMNRLLALSVRFSPRFAVRRVVRHLNLGN